MAVQGASGSATAMQDNESRVENSQLADRGGGGGREETDLCAAILSRLSIRRLYGSYSGHCWPL